MTLSRKINLHFTLLTVLNTLVYFTIKNSLFSNSIQGARVAPLSKKKTKRDMTNQNPICTLTGASKFAEKAFTYQFRVHLEINDVLTKNIYVFRPKQRSDLQYITL